MLIPINTNIIADQIKPVNLPKELELKPVQSLMTSQDISTDQVPGPTPATPEQTTEKLDTKHGKTNNEIKHIWKTMSIQVLADQGSLFEPLHQIE